MIFHRRTTCTARVSKRLCRGGNRLLTRAVPYHCPNVACPDLVLCFAGAPLKLETRRLAYCRDYSCGSILHAVSRPNGDAFAEGFLGRQRNLPEPRHIE